MAEPPWGKMSKSWVMTGVGSLETPSRELDARRQRGNREVARMIYIAIQEARSEY